MAVWGIWYWRRNRSVWCCCRRCIWKSRGSGGRSPGCIRRIVCNVSCFDAVSACILGNTWIDRFAPLRSLVWCLHCLSCGDVLLEYNSGVGECDGEVGEDLGEYDEDIDDFDPCLFEGLVDEGAEKEARHYEAEEGEGEAKVWVFWWLQSGPRVMRRRSVSRSTSMFPYFLWTRVDSHMEKLSEKSYLCFISMSVDFDLDSSIL